MASEAPCWQAYCRSSFVILSPSPARTRFAGVRGIPISFREGLQAIVFFSGQTIINNFDIVLVKHFFPPAEAGFYAAIALVGRLVNMCAWSVVNTMFPVSAAPVQRTNHRADQFCSLPSHWCSAF